MAEEEIAGEVVNTRAASLSPNAETALSERRDRVVALYVRGYSQPEIARQLGVSQTTICRDLQRARQLWRERMVASIGEQIEEELQGLRAMEVELWCAWRQSQLPTEPGGAQRPGAVKYMDSLLKVHQERNKLRGLYPASKLEVSDTTSRDASLVCAALQQQDTQELLAALTDRLAITGILPVAPATPTNPSPEQEGQQS